MRAKLTCMALLCAMLWVACSGKKADYEVVNTASAAADSSRVSNARDTAFAAPKLVKTADMHFRVKDVLRTSEDIGSLTTKYQGMVMHHNVRSAVDKSQDIPLSSDSVMRVSSVNTYAEMTVRLPSDKMEEFMNQVSHMAAYINHRNMDVEDKSLDYLSSAMKLAGRNQLIAQQSTGRIHIKNPADVLLLKDDLVDEQINNKRIDYAVKYSTIGLSFYQSNAKLHEMMINDEPSTFRVPFLIRLRNAFENGAFIFNETLVAVANLWLFILSGVAAWLIYHSYKRRQVVVVKS